MFSVKRVTRGRGIEMKRIKESETREWRGREIELILLNRTRYCNHSFSLPPFVPTPVINAAFIREMLPSYCLSSSRLSSPFSPFESNPFFISSLGRLGIHGIRKNDLRSSRISLTVAPPPPFSPRVAVCDRVYIYIYTHEYTISRRRRIAI